jgi:hypothetical protein
MDTREKTDFFHRQIPLEVHLMSKKFKNQKQFKSPLFSIENARDKFQIHCVEDTRAIVSYNQLKNQFLVKQRRINTLKRNNVMIIRR